MKKFWNSDKIVSTSAIVIGIGSLIVVTYQTNLIRNQTELIQREQRTSVMPYLQLGSRIPDGKREEIYLVNSGLGPALIKEVWVRTEDGDYAMDLDTYILENYPYEGLISVESVEIGNLLPAGEEYTMIGVEDSQDSSFVKLGDQLNGGRIIFEVTYESLYGERWLLSSTENIPKSLEED
ncbi:MAG: hypothetical protein ACFB15_07350 [Cyclobacteriaceae bacterium]